MVGNTEWTLKAKVDLTLEVQGRVLDLGLELKVDLHLRSTFEEKTRTKSKTRPKFVKSGSIVMARVSIAQPICVQLFSEYPQLGRFTLRDEGRTIAIGKVTRLPKEAGKSGASA